MALSKKKKNDKNGVKLKDILKHFDLPLNTAISSLKELGIDVTSVSSVIDEDFIDIVEEHLRELDKELKKDKKTTQDENSIHLKTPITVKSLSDALGKKPNEIITSLMSMNILANINQVVEHSAAKKIAKKYGKNLLIDKREKEEPSVELKVVEKKPDPEEIEEKDNPEDLRERPPIVTFLGHVDHGKTSLQDAIRKTNVVAGEAGGITQHIGASVVKYNNKTITFIDTPGHEAFTAMRARGARITDIAVLVVAADDGFMPQTIEALNHAKAAKVPIIIALNKMDLPGADPGKVLRQMQQHGLQPEEWGGDVAVVRVSAIRGDGINDLLERILLEAEMLQLKANPRKKARGVVIEASLEQGFGPTVNILVQNGTLKKGDFVLCGQFYGKVKNLIGAQNERFDEVGPGMPAKLVGLSGVPQSGTIFVVCENEREAKEIADRRAEENKKMQLTQNIPSSNLEDLLNKMALSQKPTLPLIIKADAQGSIEAIKESLSKFPSEKITIDVILSATGAISENDVLLASASKAIIIGFHVRVNTGVNQIAKQHGVEIRLYSIIYELIEDIKDALEGKLAPESREKIIGEAVILKIFEISKGPKVCGCSVTNGVVKVGAKARVYRENELIYNGSVMSLRRFQDDVKEVRQGFECGIRLDNFVDFKEGDKIQIYEVEFKKTNL
ncbi:MAG TPA: translation initiation factor IF-2 [Victivallales bacterium]|nr:translation initiation factor IF-2 [Victivallales bacterium]HRR05679.1 translation initiation factor IF-2 [Victivallales bacterium]HRR28834.1 translation initiation factor IF-2 [Victivallales bacterium]HRU00520.1 translation initiation factor IF-2 [Victivallales bacterium]